MNSKEVPDSGINSQQYHQEEKDNALVLNQDQSPFLLFFFFLFILFLVCFTLSSCLEPFI